MKVRDIVALKDGSYHMSLIKGKIEHIFGISLQPRRYRVLDLLGAYPAENRHSLSVQTNDTMLIDVNDPDFVLFTQERFCRIVTLAPEDSPSQPLEITVPHGTKEVRLVLQ